jgi:hypothetical protein
MVSSGSKGLKDPTLLMEIHSEKVKELILQGGREEFILLSNKGFQKSKFVAN